MSNSEIYTTIKSIVFSNFSPVCESRTVMLDALNRTLFKWWSLLERCNSTLHSLSSPRIQSASRRTERPYRFLLLLCTITSFTMSFSSSRMIRSISWHTPMSSASTSKNVSSIGLKFLTCSFFSSNVFCFFPIIWSPVFMVYKQVFRMIYVYYIEPLNILQDCSHGFFCYCFLSMSSFSPAEWFTDVVIRFLLW